MIRLSIEGHLKLREQLGFLRLSENDKRRVHSWIAQEAQRALKREVSKTVEHSPLELFDGSDVLRRRKARSFARMVGRSASAEHGVLFDNAPGHKGVRRPAKGDRATEEQALLMRRLGFRLSRAKIRRRFSRKLAGAVIRKQEARLGAEEREQMHGLRRRKSRGGSLILMVWRRNSPAILAEVDPVAIFRRFMRARLARAA